MKRRLRRPLAAVLAGALVVWWQVPAQAQLDAREEPVVSGPLHAAGEGKKCRVSKYEIEGEVVARAKICLFLYSFDSEMEDDDANDYGVMWAQTNVDTRGGWCAFTVHTEVSIPEDMPIHNRVPKARDIPKRIGVTSKLVVDAGGHATEKGSVKKRMTLYPDSLSRSRKDGDDDTDRVRVTWRGETAAKLGFVSGLEVSWPVDDGPPAAVPFRVEYPIRQC
ncbi:MAG TPA: hypothetical protein VG318_11350 [Actinomycetota bacterium]|nr:hypothetical protein [Actinomycetota bacterium]